jgi:hypothetical protein
MRTTHGPTTRIHGSGDSPVEDSAAGAVDRRVGVVAVGAPAALEDSAAGAFPAVAEDQAAGSRHTEHRSDTLATSKPMEVDDGECRRCRSREGGHR